MLNDELTDDIIKINTEQMFGDYILDSGWKVSKHVFTICSINNHYPLLFRVGDRVRLISHDNIDLLGIHPTFPDEVVCVCSAELPVNWNSVRGIRKEFLRY